VKDYKSRHPEKRRWYTATRRARQKAAEQSDIPADLMTTLFAEQGGKCPYCLGDLSSLGINVDHYIPITKGGAHAPWNLQLTCPTCNKKKAAKHPLKYLSEVFKCELMAA
jgi:5-methylcytosine-specific restriction endonuclease McrA